MTTPSLPDPVIGEEIVPPIVQHVMYALEIVDEAIQLVERAKGETGYSQTGLLERIAHLLSHHAQPVPQSVPLSLPSTE